MSTAETTTTTATTTTAATTTTITTTTTTPATTAHVAATAFFSPEIKDKPLCLICKDILTKYKGQCVLGDDGWIQFQSAAVTWSDIVVPQDHQYFPYTQVSHIVENVSEPFGTVHRSCRSNFNSKSLREKCEKRFGKKSDLASSKDTEQPIADTEESATGSPVKKRLRSSINIVETHLCFICNVEGTNDHLLYADGGLARCARDTAGKRLEMRKDLILKEGDKSHFHYDAARRLDLILKATDIWAADIYTHKKCYMGFAYPYEHVVPDDENETETLAITTFFHNVKQKILKEKCAFLLTDLLNDIKSICEELKLQEPVVSNKRTLQRRISERFGNAIEFTVPRDGGATIVHSADMNPCEYAVAALHGCGLRDDDFIRGFGKLVKRNIQKPPKKRWPLTPEELIEELDRGPSPVLYNTIYSTLEESCKKNSYGYYITDSTLKATKIWSLASDWESLITREVTGKQAALGLIIHRDTSSKSGINFLHKLNHTLSYNAIRLQNEAWAGMITNKSYCAASFRKGVTTHSTMDNNDGKQETIDGTGTTHDTNITMFQLPNEDEMSLPTIRETQDIPTKLSDPLETDHNVKPYFIGKLVGPPKFSYNDSNEDNELQFCLRRDIAWAAAGSLGTEDSDGIAYDSLGSWTNFLKQTVNSTPIKCVQEYQPVWPHPPEYPICKKYLDSIIDIINDLKISHMFVHTDELVYSKLCNILWKNPELYKNIILLMGGFHQLRVMQKILYKRYNCRHMQQICVEAEIIAKGSSDQAFEGRHYYRCLRVHKECFDALVQLRIEGLTNYHSETAPDLLDKLKNLRRSPTADTLNDVMECAEFNALCGEALNYTPGTEAHLSVEYLKDVSLTLALLSAVREGNFERHLQAEKPMARRCLALDHPNYGRFLTYEHVYLSNLKDINRLAYDDLATKGFGASITGQPFSSIHGDLVTEYYNRTTKGTSGPFRAGYSRNTDAVNRWVKTIHVHSKLKEEFKNLLHIKTSSKHKELTTGGKLLHQKHVQKIKQRIRHLEIDPFATNAPISFSDGVEIPVEIVTDMLRVDEVGQVKIEKFIKERLVDQSISFYTPITQSKLNTGIKKKKQTARTTEILKEDKQAFGLLVGKSISDTEAFSHPLTTYPLAIATPEGELYQGDKAMWRNYLIQTPSSTTTESPKQCAWLVDGMAVIRALKPCGTYKAFADSLITFLSSLTENCQPTVVGVINDCYLDDSTKNGTRAGRGKAGSKVNITSINQTMLKGMRWNEFLHNAANKEALITAITRYLRSENRRLTLPFPMIVNDKYDTMSINSEGVTNLFQCNHEEGDYRLVLHALISQQDCVIVAKDTDVLVLLVWAYVHFNIQFKWYMMYEKGVFAEISIICQYFGSTICENILSYHAITGCDTTSYMFRVGKIKVFQKLVKNSDLCLLLHALENVDPLQETDINDLKQFVQTVMYSGKVSESYVETRKRLYDQQKTKNSTNIPPDPDSLFQDLKRKQLQVYIWRQLDKISMSIVDKRLYGWKVLDDGMVVPVWFTGNQLPPSLQRSRRQRGKKRSCETSSTDDGFSARKRIGDSDSELADGELSDVTITVPTVEIVLPSETIVYESSKTNDGSDGDDEYDTAVEHECSGWEPSDYCASSNDSGSDFEWMP